MALPDPQPLTLNGAQSLAKIIDDGLKSVYTSPDGKITLTVSHQITAGKRRKTLVRIDETVVAADPLTAVNTTMTGSTYVVFDFPVWGFSQAQKVAQLTGLTGSLTASSNALATRILNGEH